MKIKNPYVSPLIAVLHINGDQRIANDMISGNFDDSVFDPEGDIMDAF